jgi:pimeloyl-ACP methyl ester carboxylesterase
MRLVTHRLPGMILTDHEFTVPLDHARPTGEKITLFAREVVAPNQEHGELPWLVFFQGGPGLDSPRPDEHLLLGWLKPALKEYRVLLLDQRGIGRSTPINPQTLAHFETPQAQADYLKLFRADSIVRDAESIRRELIGDQTWSVLGQSFGGFCVTTYLSIAPEGLREAIITGGLPPIKRSTDEVYRATYQRVLEKNRRYFERYPGDAKRAREIADLLSAQEVRLPNGDRLTAHRFQQLGMNFGASDGFEKVHYVLEEAFVMGRSGHELNYKFLRDFENLFAFDTNPIYAVLHEACYCQGEASNWSAERVRAEYPQFDLASNKQVYFTGEMIYPWMFDEYQRLQPLKAAAQLLAEYDQWPALYDREVLQANIVPCAATLYFNDMYVERAFALEAAEAIRGIKVWITNEYEHNALRGDGDRLLSHLLDMLHEHK